MLLVTGCSSFKKATVNLSSHFLYDIGIEFQREADWHHLKESMPGALKILEGMHSINPHNKKLKIALIKGYAGYAFAIWETLALEDTLSKERKTYALEKTVQFYSRAIGYGLAFLIDEGTNYKRLQATMGTENGVMKLLNDKLDQDNKLDQEGVLYLALSIGSLIHLQKTNVALMAQLPIVKGMFDWACRENPHLHYGTCGIFYGSYEASIPKMLGGNPEKGKKIFEQLIKSHEDNWLARVAYIQYYAIPMADKKIYAEQKKFLENAVLVVERGNKWFPGKVQNNAFKQKNIRTFQAIAIERFKTIKKYEKDIF